jgi:hypothetical protein
MSGRQMHLKSWETWGEQERSSPGTICVQPFACQRRSPQATPKSAKPFVTELTYASPVVYTVATNGTWLVITDDAFQTQLLNFALRSPAPGWLAIAGQIKNEVNSWWNQH